MLKILNDLRPFIEDCYRELGVREYSRLMKITPPTASKTLKEFESEGLLKKRTERNYLLFRANKESNLFKDLALAYWRERLARLFEEIHEKFLFGEIILFGSISKVENTIDSDIDIYADIPKKKIDTTSIEKKLKRDIQIHFKEKSKNSLLLKNIKKGLKIL